MPGAHNENTKLIGFYAFDELVEKIEDVRGDKGRSQFLREAVIAYLVSNGVNVPEHLRHAPDRAGKGGPIKYKLKALAESGAKKQRARRQKKPPSV